MRAERRALEAEPPTVERPELSIDHLLRGKNRPAELAGELLGRAEDRLARATECPMRPAVQTVLATAEIEPPVTNPQLARKDRAALLASLHRRDRT